MYRGIILASLTFVISPVFGVFVSFIHVLICKEKVTALHFIFLFSLMLGIINSGKVAESDLLNYRTWFFEIKTYNLYDYVLTKGKEPLFFVYNFFLYYLTFGNFEAYLIFNTTVCYFLLGFGLFRVHQTLQYSQFVLLAALMVLFLFPNIFSLSAHLIRQFFAASLLSLFLVELVFYRRNRILLFLVAVFTHTSSIIYGVVFLLNRRNIESKQLIKAVFKALMLCVLVWLILKQIQFELNNNLFSYGLTRLMSVTESTVKLDKVGLVNFILFGLVVYIFYINKKINSSSVKILYFLSIILFLFVLLNYNNTEMALRFSFFFYFLLPLSIYIFLNKWDIKNRIEKKLGPLIYVMVFFVLWFVLKINFGAWQYDKMSRIFFIGYW